MKIRNLFTFVNQSPDGNLTIATCVKAFPPFRSKNPALARLFSSPISVYLRCIRSRHPKTATDMIRDIVIYGEPVLRTKCEPVSEVTPEIEELAQDMVETMVEAQGVGLAAPQVAVPIQLAIVDVTGSENACTYLHIDGEEADLEDWMPLIYINPELELSRNRDLDFEGCLSIPDLREKVNRPAEVTAKLTLLDGRQIVLEADGLLARAIQHETDHLNGILFIDRLSAVAKIGAKKRLRILQAEWAEEK